MNVTRKGENFVLELEPEAANALASWFYMRMLGDGGGPWAYFSSLLQLMKRAGVSTGWEYLGDASDDCTFASEWPHGHPLKKTFEAHVWADNEHIGPWIHVPEEFAGKTIKVTVEPA